MGRNKPKRIPMFTFSSPIRNSLAALLGSPEPADPRATVGEIRRTMLHALGEDGRHVNPRLHQRLNTLGSAQALWFARAELFTQLCHLHGQCVAQQRLERLQPLFEGWLPRSLLPRARSRIV